MSTFAAHPGSDRLRAIRHALSILGIDRFVLAIHDPCFPSDPGEESGRGTPYGKGGAGFLEFAAGLGFNVIQLGPQGLTSRADPSPYNGSVFARDPLSLSPHALAQTPLASEVISTEDIKAFVREAAIRQSGRVEYAAARRYAGRLLDTAHRRHEKLRDINSPFSAAFTEYCRSIARKPIDWFDRDRLFEICATGAATDDWRVWEATERDLFAPSPGSEQQADSRRTQLLRRHPRPAERFALGQFLLRLQHEQFRARMKKLGLALYGDAHIGFSHRDRWAWRSCFLPGYLMGAPPSRSNPEGQPWGYPVLDPSRLHHGGISLELITARFDALFDNYDGVRIDHPHGLVCPWVYRSDDPDPFHAVRNGARLNCTPALPGHEALAPFSLVDPGQLDLSPGCSRWDDEFVRDLRPDQIDRFGMVIDTILDRASAKGFAPDSVLCEVLSTWPSPLREVMRRRGLGRFCVTQKADPRDPGDVYRSENTGPSDWIMVGNHDTAPLWRVVRERGSNWQSERASLLALHLAREPEERQRLQARLATDTRAFCKAMFTELFLAPAKNISVFFPDLLGMDEKYNTPGTVGPHNWTLRVPRDYERVYAQRCARGEAFDIADCLGAALRVRCGSADGDAAALAARLERK